ncbi:hypothetical protein HpSP79_03940 [Helicobacter pylori]
MKQLDVLRFSLGVLWLWSGVQPALTAADVSLDLLSRTGIAAEWQAAAFYTSSALDVFFGILCFTKFRNYRFLWLAQFVVVLGYSVIVACRLPEMWLHPFAPLVKNVPILAALWVLGSRHERADVPAAQ